jgi:hypothetical protein
MVTNWRCKNCGMVNLLPSDTCSRCKKDGNEERQKLEEKKEKAKTKITSFWGDFWWEDSKDKIKSLELLKLIGEEKESLNYATSIMGMNCLRIYEFLEDKLSSITYIITETFSEANIYIDKYKKLYSLLDEKYSANNGFTRLHLRWGKGVSCKSTIAQSPFRDWEYNESVWGEALNREYLFFHSGWQCSELDIIITVVLKKTKNFVFYLTCDKLTMQEANKFCNLWTKYNDTSKYVSHET